MPLPITTKTGKLPKPKHIKTVRKTVWQGLWIKMLSVKKSLILTVNAKEHTKHTAPKVQDAKSRTEMIKKKVKEKSILLIICYWKVLYMPTISVTAYIKNILQVASWLLPKTIKMMLKTAYPAFLTRKVNLPLSAII